MKPNVYISKGFTQLFWGISSPKLAASFCFVKGRRSEKNGGNPKNVCYDHFQSGRTCIENFKHAQNKYLAFLRYYTKRKNRVKKNVVTEEMRKPHTK